MDILTHVCLALLWKFHYILPRHSLLMIHKTFVRPHFRFWLCGLWQSVQWMVSSKTLICSMQCCVSHGRGTDTWQVQSGGLIHNRCNPGDWYMTGAIRGTNTEKLYQELGLESLQYRCKLQKVGNCRKFIGSKWSCEN